MYIPPLFREERPEKLRELIENNPFAVLVSCGSPGLIATHLPLLYATTPELPLGSLHGHIARANSQWEQWKSGEEVLAIFQGPHTYVSPGWYPSTATTGRVVPTWNYAVVHVYGHVEVYEDAARIRRHVDALTAMAERRRESPWSSASAPKDFVEGMLRGIVGVDMKVTRWEGKWKVSQNRTTEDRAGVLCALRGQNDPVSIEMANLVEEYGTR